MITVELAGAEELRLKLSSMSQRMMEALDKGMKVAMFNLQRYVKGNELSGQALHVRTGNLRASINAQVAQTGEEVIGSVGTNVFYARIHEYGGTVNIPEHQRTSIKGTVSTVRAHSATFPQRSFLRASLQDTRDQIIETLQNSVSEEINA